MLWDYIQPEWSLLPNQSRHQLLSPSYYENSEKVGFEFVMVSSIILIQRQADLLARSPLFLFCPYSGLTQKSFINTHPLSSSSNQALSPRRLLNFTRVLSSGVSSSISKPEIQLMRIS